MTQQSIEILFFGDLVGRSGRDIVRHYLKGLTSKPDIIIANGENVTHGFGLNERHYRELLDMGIHILTGGNHTFDRQEIMEYLPEASQILRPENFPGNLPGTGAKVFEVNGIRIGVLNLMAQVFMANYNSPWECIDRLLPELKSQTPIIFMDFHGEATAEKIAMGRYASKHKVSAMVGTHTHVQTADERILNGQMGYITDAGFNGAYDSVIGMEESGSLERLKCQTPVRLEVAYSDKVQLNAVSFKIDPATGKCLDVQRINKVQVLSESNV